MTNQRGFSTEFHDHQGLIMQISRKCLGRLNALGIYADLEDVFQENCMTYVKAVNKYNPNLGITFSAYMGRAIYNEFNIYVERLIQREKVTPSISFADEKEFDDLLAIHEDEGDAGVEELSVLSDDIRERVSSLSPTAKLIIRELISPSKGVLVTFEAMRAHADHAQTMNKTVFKPKEVNIKVIRKHYGIKTEQMNELRMEFKHMLGVEIG